MLSIVLGALAVAGVIVLAEHIGPAEAQHRDDVKRELRSRLRETEAQNRLEVRQAVRPTQVRFVPIEDQPGHQGQGLRDDREIDTADPAAKGKKPEE